jgi:hypothetical protein
MEGLLGEPGGCLCRAGKDGQTENACFDPNARLHEPATPRCLFDVFYLCWPVKQPSLSVTCK